MLNFELTQNGNNHKLIIRILIFIIITLFFKASFLVHANECTMVIKNEFEKIQKEKIEADNKIYKDKVISWEKQAWMILYNYRTYICSLESVCLSLEQYIFNEWKDEEGSVRQSIIWCWKYKIDMNKFNGCYQNVQNQIKRLLEVHDACREIKNNKIEYEKNRITHEFWTYSMQDKTNFLSAKLLTMNVKMKEFALSMFKLRTLFEKIINKVFCRQE